MTSILAFVRARLDIVEMSRKYGASKTPDYFTKVCVEAALAIRAQVRSVNVLEADVAAIILSEIETSLPKEQFEIVFSTVQEKLQSQENKGESSFCFNNPEDFVPPRLWAVIDGGDLMAAVTAVAVHFALLGVQCGHELSVNKMLSLALLRFWDTSSHGLNMQQVDSLRKRFKHTIRSAAGASQDRPVFNGTMDAIAFSNTYKAHWDRAMTGESPVTLTHRDMIVMKTVRDSLGCRVSKGRVRNEMFGNQCRSNSMFNILENRLNTCGSTALSAPTIYMPNGVPIQIIQRQPSFNTGSPDSDRFSPSPSPPPDRLAIEDKSMHATNTPAKEAPSKTGEAQDSATTQSAVDHVNAIKEKVMGKPDRKRKLVKKKSKKSDSEESESEDETYESKRIPMKSNTKKRPAAAMSASSVKKETGCKKGAGGASKTKSKDKKRKTSAPKECYGIMKRPAAKDLLRFPGEGKREKMLYGDSIVYFSDKRYRLMKHYSDRVDVSYYYKTKSAREAWAELVNELRRLNPCA